MTRWKSKQLEKINKSLLKEGTSYIIIRVRTVMKITDNNEIL